MTNIKVTKDFTMNFNQIIKKFKNDQVLIGIPEEKATRSADSKVNNATLLALNNFGSPRLNIPARPVMQNGIKNAADQIANQFKLAAIAGLELGSAGVDSYYERAGIIASTSIKKAINAQDFRGGGPNNSGPAPSTLIARKAAGFKGAKSLIVTGQMRNAITYVVKGRSG